MRIKFWGTRGSLPKATTHKDVIKLLEFLVNESKKQDNSSIDELMDSIRSGQLPNPLSYGGNTTCLEISQGDEFYVIDMGSGLREAGTVYTSEGHKEFKIFLTHLHWDHIMGLPFFIPIYSPGTRIIIHHVHEKAPEFVKIQFNGVNFPRTWDSLGAVMEFKKLPLHKPIKTGNAKITPFQLDHPGEAYGYRFDIGGKSISIGIDSEYKRLTPSALGRDLPFYQNLDLLVFDAQYEMSELAARFDWGHSAPNIGVDLALREGIKRLVLAHHDPWSDWEKLTRSTHATKEYLKAHLETYKEVWKDQPEGPEIHCAYDGLEIKV